MGQLGENGLTDGEDGGIIEERAESNYIQDAKTGHLSTDLEVIIFITRYR